MQAKIMLLPASSKGKTLCSYAEELFLEISASFGHGLNTLREKIGEDSVRLFDVPLTQETADACKKCNAVFLADADCEGSRELYQALGIPLRVRSFCFPDTLSSPAVPKRHMQLCHALALDQDTVLPLSARRCSWQAIRKSPSAMYPPPAITALPGRPISRKTSSATPPFPGRPFLRRRL